MIGVEFAAAGHTLGRPLGIELSFDQLYERDERLRSGSFGTVYTCHRRTHPETTYAVKILDRKKLKKKDDDAVFREVSILNKIDNPHVISLIDFFVEPNHLYMVQAYAGGGDVFDRLTSLTHYTEHHARRLARNLLEAVAHLHSFRPSPIAHRDLKPENILLQSALDDSNILVADFGFARHVPSGGMKSRCGTPAFVSPEILTGTNYHEKTDLWSVGCIIYMLIGGYPPFQGKNHRDLFRRVRACDFVFHEAYWANASVEVKRLITGLLTVNVDKRWSAQEALACDWFQEVPAADLKTNDLSGSIEEMKRHRARMRWKATFRALGFAASAPFWKTDAVTFNLQVISWDKLALDASVNASASSVTTTASLPTSKIHAIKFDDNYERVRLIRKGSHAAVWECMHRVTKERFAVKIVDRSGLANKDDEAVLNEVAMMQSLAGNRYVVQILDFYEEDDFFYLVLELMSGGDVFDRVVKMSFYTERDARDLARILLKAVASIHKHGIAHRDIKPQNILLSSEDDNSLVKIADFGFAHRVHMPESLTSRVGTPTYVAPEILKNVPHDNRCDMWSVGVVVFVLLVGYPPFLEDDQTVLFEKIRNADWKFVEKDWRHISFEAKKFIQGLLVPDPKDRWSVQEALRSTWIKEDPNQLSTIDLSESLEHLRSRKARLRSITKAVILMGRYGKTEDPPTKADEYPAERQAS